MTTQQMLDLHLDEMKMQITIRRERVMKLEAEINAIYTEQGRFEKLKNELEKQCEGK
jgi:hypothetical protein